MRWISTAASSCALGIPTEMFTVMFAIGRMPGWIANFKEVMDDPKSRIYRPRQISPAPRCGTTLPSNTADPLRKNPAAFPLPFRSRNE